MENFESRNFRRQQEKIRLRLIFVTWCRWSELYITLLQNDAIETHTQGPDHLLPSLSTPDWNMEKSGAIRWTLWDMEKCDACKTQKQSLSLGKPPNNNKT
jgi:hypothetical protein